MGNVIFDCDKETIIKNGEIHISINHVKTWKKKEKEIQSLILHIEKYYFNLLITRLKLHIQEKEKEEKENDNQNIISDNKYILLNKNPPESNISILDNLTLNSSMKGKNIEEDSQIIGEGKNKNIHIQNIKNNNEEKKNETPDGENNIIFQPNSEPPPKKESSSEKNKKITKAKKKKKSPKKETTLTPIFEEIPSQNYDKTLIPGDLILHFNDIPQTDKITEIENNIGGEFIIEEKELSKYMKKYPYVPKLFSIRYSTGEIYSGYFSPDWVKEVFGIQIDKNGSKYVGCFKNGMFEGRGRLILHKGDYYEGEFVQNKANGYGKYVNNKGEIYNGFWIDDKQEGEGELILKDGSIYRGEFKNGKKNGKGKITWNDNSYYEGNFVDNYYEGYGVYIMINKRKGYIGQWKEGKMNGFGVFFWGDGRTYVGYYESDKKHGYGIYSGKNNLRYEGKYKKGKQYGMGRIVNEKGENQLGLYLKGKKLKYLNEKDFQDDIKNLDAEIEKINNIFKTNEFIVKNRDLMNITLDQT